MTGLLTTCGREFHDWSAEYRLFSHDRFPAGGVFSVIRRAILEQLPPQAPFSVAVDDSLLRKTGTRIPGVGWRRDPLGPKFHTNFVRAQRFLQLSAAVPFSATTQRLVPIAFLHAPTPDKPSPKATPEQETAYRKAARQAALPLLAAQQVAALRQSLDAEPNGASRTLQVLVDGGYTNATVLKKLPPRTTLIGRIRKDAKLYLLPEAVRSATHSGRPRHYGALAPTPEQLRTDDTVPWISVPVSLAGHTHQLRVKRLTAVLWRTAGLQHTLQLVVIAPLGYRLRKSSKVLYRRPAFLICTDPTLALHDLLHSYIQRWDIEVNFREEKTLLGVGQAQVRHPKSVQSVPALQVASYAMLLLATLRAKHPSSQPDLLPRPKWADSSAPRFSAQRAIHHLRGEVWGRALGLVNFSDFATQSTPSTKPQKFLPDLRSAILYAVQ